MAYKSKYARMMEEAAADAELTRCAEAVRQCNGALLRAMAYARIAGINMSDIPLWEKATKRATAFFLCRQIMWNDRMHTNPLTGMGAIYVASTVDIAVDIVPPRRDAVAAAHEWMREALRLFGRVILYSIEFSKLDGDEKRLEMVLADAVSGLILDVVAE